MARGQAVARRKVALPIHFPINLRVVGRDIGVESCHNGRQEKKKVAEPSRLRHPLSRLFQVVAKFPNRRAEIHVAKSTINFAGSTCCLSVGSGSIPGLAGNLSKD